MRQDAQKQAGKFCTRKTAKNAKTHPIQPEKGETGCVLGAGESSSGWRRMRADEKGRSEQGRGGRLLLSLAKMEGRTCLACWLGQLAAERHWRSLAPRHAVLEWMGGTQPEAGEARWCPFSHTSPKPGGAGLVLWGNFAVAVAVKLPQIQSGSPPGSAGCPQRTAVSFPPGPRPASQKTPGWRR